MDAFRLLHPRESFAKWVSRGARPDGRQLAQARQTTLRTDVVPRAVGSAMVSVGRTTVLAGITAALGQPLEAAPSHGAVEFEVTLSPLCSPAFGFGAQADEANAVADLLHRVILDGDVLALDELCVEEGAAAWQLSLDIVCLDHSGNLRDAALIAAVAALRAMRLPTVVPGAAEGEPPAVTAERTNAVSLRRLPVPLTFGAFDGHLLTDPTAEEEELVEALFTIVVDEEGQLCAVEKHGGADLLPAQLADCVAVCGRRGEEVRAMF